MTEHEEEMFHALLSEAAPELPDNGFAANIARQIKRELWVRRIVLGLAGILASIVGISLLWSFSVDFSRELIAAPSRLSDPAWLAANESMLLTLAMLVGSPLVIRFLAR